MQHEGSMRYDHDPRVRWARDNLVWLALLAIAVVNVVRGCAHFLLPDGGASAAGMRLDHSGADDLIYVFAVSGAFEVLLGLWLAYIALRQRTLLGLALWTQIAKSGLVLLLGYALKPPVGTPPGQLPDWATLIVAALCLVFLGLSGRHRKK